VVFDSDRCTAEEQRNEYPDCDRTIWRVEDDGSTGLRRLQPARGNPMQPSFAAGGTLVAFERFGLSSTGEVGELELWRVRLDGTQARRVATAHELGVSHIRALDASPVGREVVVAGPPRGAGGRDDLFVTSLDGGPVRPLTSGSRTTDLDPKVSPDGTKVAFFRGGVEAPWGVYAVALRGGPVVPVVVGTLPDTGRLSAPGSAHALAWAPDGRALAFASGQLIYAVTTDGRDLRVVGDIATSASDLAWTGAPSGLLLSDPYLPLVGDQRRYPGFAPGSSPSYAGGARPLYRMELGLPSVVARPFTPLVLGQTAQESFSGDGSPDWAPTGAVPLPTDRRPPALELVDAVDGRLAGLSRGRRRGRKRAVSARRLGFLAADTGGVRRVEAAVGRRAGGRGKRRLCRFATGRRSLRRRCSRPVFVRLRTGRSLSRLARALGPGRYEIRLRASDRRRNRTARPRLLSLRVRR
jgi:hypothetical protein